jgi:Ulp1 family protease
MQDRVYIFSCVFYTKISLLQNSSPDVNSVLRWIESVDIFSKDFLLIPMNESHHWNLMIVCFAGTEKMCLLLFDSLRRDPYVYNQAVAVRE